MITHQKTAGNWKSRVAFFSQKMGLYLGLPQDNYPGRRPQAPACFKYIYNMIYIHWMWPPFPVLVTTQISTSLVGDHILHLQDFHWKGGRFHLKLHGNMSHPSGHVEGTGVGACIFSGWHFQWRCHNTKRKASAYWKITCIYHISINRKGFHCPHGYQ